MNYSKDQSILLLLADKIEEMKTMCWFCHKKAIMNMRMHNGKPVYTEIRSWWVGMKIIIQSAGNIIMTIRCEKLL